MKDKEVMIAFNKAVLSKFKISLEGFFRVLDHNYEQQINAQNFVNSIEKYELLLDQD